MATVIFYEKPGCAGNARQKALLAAAGHRVDARNLLAAEWDPQTLRSFFAKLPVAAWFNRASPRVKSGEIVPEAIDAAQALAAMIADPLLIRRPLMQVGETRRAGFDPRSVDQWIGLSTAGRLAGDVETCRRGGVSPCPPPGDARLAGQRETMAPSTSLT